MDLKEIKRINYLEMKITLLKLNLHGLIKQQIRHR